MSRRQRFKRQQKRDKRGRQDAQAYIRHKNAVDRERAKQRASGMPSDVYALGRALGCVQ